MKTINRMNKKLLNLAVAPMMLSTAMCVQADTVYNDDLIAKGSLCVGLDCVNGESFGFDTIRLKENNVRIKAQDTSNSSSFPTTDWQITFNDSGNGGANKFSIDDIDSGKTPFTIEASAPSHTLYVSDGGQIGLGTSTPVVDLHIKGGNTPTLRLEQDGSSGFASQTWDVAGNETNFFVRDLSNGSALPFRILPGAPNSSIYIAADGDVGLSTSTPDGLFDVAHSDNANNHAFIVDTSSNVGVNINNGFTPAGLFDVQTTGGVSRFTVASDGNVGIGTSSPERNLQVYAGPTADAILAVGGTIASGEPSVNIGHAGASTGRGAGFFASRPDASAVAPNPSLRFLTNNQERLIIDDEGYLGIGTSNPAYPIEVGIANGAHLTTGGSWVTSSSREYKDNIEKLSFQEASEALNLLEPVKYVYKNSRNEQNVGFIAEDVPELVATNSRKGLSSMDFVAMLTKIVQKQQSDIEQLSQKIVKLEQEKSDSE